jgi:hypothetical protein
MILRRTSLAALLDVPADELLGVLLEDLIDLVEQLIDPVKQLSLGRMGPAQLGIAFRLAWSVRLWCEPS